MEQTREEIEKEIWADITAKSKASRQRKRNLKRENFNKVAKEKNFIILSEHNDIIKFSYFDTEYYYVIKSNKFRKAGSLEYMEFSLFEDKGSYDEDYVFAFGKYKGRTLDFVNNIDRPYLLWLLNADKLNPLLRATLEKMFENEEKTLTLHYTISESELESLIDILGIEIPPGRKPFDIGQINIKVT